ncbi:MAG: alpha,alpha-trehalase TreF [Bacteroidota bacterium]
MKLRRLLILGLLMAGLFACQTPPSSPPAGEIMLEPLVPEEDLGEVFEAVQMAGVFEDSKTFVDCRPTINPERIIAAYREQKNQPDFDLEQFVEAHFLPPRVFNSDFHSDPNRSIGEHIVALWPVLTRQPDQNISGSLLELPNPYVVPGGRFREIYYWDSYFTMLGLQVSPPEYQALIGSMIDNFSFLIDTLGFIPNGNRTYFLGRSQPPFFSLMVKLWDQVEPGALTQYLPQLEKEYAFWMAGAEELSGAKLVHRRVVRLADGTVMNRYWDDHPAPRPESYREDVELAESSQREPTQLYRDLRAACESGWDFSSRWLQDQQNLASIRTTQLVPVDLNCLIYHLEKTLAEVYEATGQTEQASKMDSIATRRAASIERFCWSEEGFYGDYDWLNQKSTDILTAAAMFPLFFELSDSERATEVHDAVSQGLLAPGGIRTTTSPSGQQWDDPNGWAPLQWISYLGMKNYGFEETAASIKQRWISLNTKVYQNTGRMVEKYNVGDLSLEAGGGEYTLQDGFGWSNGVLLRMLKEEE